MYLKYIRSSARKILVFVCYNLKALARKNLARCCYRVLSEKLLTNFRLLCHDDTELGLQDISYIPQFFPAKLFY